MTELVFRDDAYARSCEATVTGAGPEGVRLDRTVFYARGGGQPGDTGRLVLTGGRTVPIADAVKGDQGPDDVVHVPAEGATLPEAGAKVTAEVDWARRHRLMRTHTGMHLLCALVSGAVTGGSVGDGRGRLDFDLPEGAPDKADLTERLNRLIAEDHPVRAGWISAEELAANPDLVRTMSVRPPMGSGRVRTIRIGAPESDPVDYQPCGGTHVAHTAEIGRVEVRKIESKGRQNRRISFVLADNEC